MSASRFLCIFENQTAGIVIVEESVREVLETARVEDVVRDFVDLKRRGQNYIGLCPFHTEKTPSFNVNPARNIFKCFGCGQSGDAVKFLMELEQLTFPDAIRSLAKKYNIKLKETEPDPQYQAEQQAQESLFLINQFARDFYQQQLFESDRGRSIGLSYFKERGYREDIIRRFDLGFAPADGDALTRAAKAAGYKIEKLQQLGLSNAQERDFFRDRAIFTIHNVSGKIIAFAGRVLQKDAKGPKYINSPETEIYHKSDVLYGVHQARQAMRRQDLVYLVEGYTDVISLHQAGVENVVASSGTSLTPGQVRLIKRYTPNVCLLYDGDPAGIKAALRGVDLLLEQDLNVRVVLLPNGEDPDSYVHKVGAEAFSTYLREQAQDFILFKSDLLLREAGRDPIKKAGLIGDITESIAKIPDPLKRTLYTKECARLFEIDEQLLVAKVNQLVARQVQKYQQRRDAELPTAADEPPFPTKEPGSAAPADKPAPVGHEFQERDLVRVLMTSGHQLYDLEEQITVAQYIIDNIEDALEDFDHAFYRRIVELCLDHLDNTGEAPPPDFFLRYEDEAIRQLAIDFNTAPYELSPNWAKHNVSLNQKAPEENYKNDAEQSLVRFLHVKVKRRLEKVIVDIERLSKEGKEEELLIHLRLQQRYKQIEMDLARRTQTVVL